MVTERNTRLDIIADGFLDRQTLLRMAGTRRFTLWPREHANGLNEEFTKDIVYVTGDSRLRGMIRISLGESEAYVVPSSEIRADFRAMRAVQAAADNISKATRGELRFIVTDRPPPGAVVFDDRNVRTPSALMAGEPWVSVVRCQY